LADPDNQRIPTPLHEGLLAIVESLRGLQRRIEIVEKQIVGARRTFAAGGTISRAPTWASLAPCSPRVRAHGLKAHAVKTAARAPAAVASRCARGQS
jgi:hypothetical protein